MLLDKKRVGKRDSVLSVGRVPLEGSAGSALGFLLERGLDPPQSLSVTC